MMAAREDYTRLLDEPRSELRLRLAYLLRALVAASGLFVLALTEWGKPGNIVTLCVLLVLASVGWAKGALRKAHAYRDGWVDGHHACLQQLPLVLAGMVRPDIWYRRQLAAELTALGMDPEQVLCHLDEPDPADLDDMGGVNGR